MDPAYEPDNLETRTLFGMQLQQKTNDAKIDANLFKKIVTQCQEVELHCVFNFIYCAILLSFLKVLCVI